MQKATTFTCSRCGGEISPTARRCGYCAAPLASVRCANCYEMNVPDALHCRGCGRELGLEPVGATGQCHCPSCRVPLTEFKSTTGTLFDCDSCGGQFVEHALLRDLFERSVTAIATGPHPIAPANPLTQPVRYLKCPDCSTLMNRQNFGRTSGIIVDVCHRHGIWFDTGELPRILAFVEAGGLVESRRRELEELDRRTGARHAFGNPQSEPQQFDSAHVSGAPSLLDDMEDACSALIAYVREKLANR